MLMAPVATARDGAVHDALRDQLVALFPPSARIRAHGWRPWASASFVGARHWFDVTGGHAGHDVTDHAAWTERLWTVPGSFVADVATSDDASGPDAWRVELLTVDD